MILKSLDTHTKDIDTLNSFLINPNIPDTVKQNIEKEIKCINSGNKAQKEAAYNIDFLFGSHENTFVIHDLRIVVDNKVAQIDHLIINRLMETFVCETKNFSEGISINEQLEFTAFYNNKPYGIASPIEQNNKHIMVLQDLFNKDIITSPRRLGFKIPMKFNNVILISNKARITRPKRSLGNVTLIKNEGFEKYYHDNKNIETSSILKIVSAKTIEDLSKSIVNLHTPITFDWIGKFGLQKYLNIPNDTIKNININKNEVIISEKKAEVLEKKSSKTYYCEVCNTEIDNGVVFWCRKNKSKFDGKLLCREHQVK